MPKLPGRESTRKTVKLENIEGVGSFIAVWDKYVYKKRCQVEGCDHVISGRHDPETSTWVTCGEGSGAAIVHDKTEQAGRHTAYAICVCCLDAFNDYWKAANGDPE